MKSFSASSSVFQGAWAGIHAAEYASKVDRVPLNKTEVAESKEEMYESRFKTSGVTPDWVTHVLQGIMMPYYVLAIKKADRLEAALSNIAFVRDHLLPKMMASDSHQLKLVHEVHNMALNSEMKLRAGLMRTESRGSHFREDYPVKDDENWLAWIRIKDVDGKMTLTKEEIPEEWRPQV